MPKAIKRKVIKPAGTEDNVKDVLEHTREAMKRRRNTVVSVSTVLIVVLLAVSGVFFYRSNMKSKAEKLEYEAYKLYYGLHQKQPLPKQQQYQKALEVFKSAYEARKSPLPLFYMANANYDLGNYDEALRALKELNERFPDDEHYVPLAYYKIALIHLKKGDKEGALNSLNVIYNYKTGSFKDLALIESARILESLGKTDDARKRYEELTRDFPTSPFLDEARAKTGEKKG